ncbi:MAG TPA: DNA-packaging protein [Bacillota bacterium]|nr:DNA-packaging protein [Bacillota bacterium]
MALLDDVKVALRISDTNTAFDGEVSDLISAAQRDLLVAGIKVTDETDALIKRAIVTYAKAHFGYDNPDADRLLKAYEMLKMHLMLSTEYNSEV